METDDTSPSMGQPTISHANTTVVYWAEELGNQIVWKAARIETLLSAHKAHCQNTGSSLVINDVMADALTDLVKLFDVSQDLQLDVNNVFYADHTGLVSTRLDHHGQGSEGELLAQISV